MLKSAFISSSVLSWLSSIRRVRDFSNNSWSILILPPEYKHWNLDGLIFNTFRALVLSTTIRLFLAFASSSSSSPSFRSENAHARYCWPKIKKTKKQKTRLKCLFVPLIAQNMTKWLEKSVSMQGQSLAIQKSLAYVMAATAMLWQQLLCQEVTQIKMC